MNISDLNYFNDPRNQPAPDLSGYPTRWAICDVCQGDGKTVNASIDAGGLSADQQDDPDFMDDYMGGRYDTACNCCGGTGKVKEINFEAMTAADVAEYDAEQEDLSASRAENLAELMHGA